MNVDKFGQHVNKRQYLNISIEDLFVLINGAYIDARNKIIKHAGSPKDPTDCATKQYVDNVLNNEISKNIKSINQTLNQVNSEINSLKQNIDSLSQKVKKK